MLFTYSLNPNLILQVGIKEKKQFLLEGVSEQTGRINLKHDLEYSGTLDYTHPGIKPN